MIRPIALVAVSCLAASCASAPKATYLADTSFAPSQYKTFSWVADDPQLTTRPDYSTRNDERIEAALVAGLEQKGYAFVADRSEADFVVGYSVVLSAKIKSSGGSEYFGGNWNHASGYLRVGGERLPTSSVGAPSGFWDGIYRDSGATIQKGKTEATLIVDVFAAGSKDRTWQGSVSKKITQSDREHPDDTVRDAVARVFEAFPDRTPE